MLDEIDKLGMDFRGDPASALLEVLDPEQNVSFRDHYVDVAFDLSRVLFVTTANVIDTVPPALRDRMEIIHLAGYTEEEKIAIAQRHLVPKEAREHGLDPGKDIEFTPEALRLLARGYTREAGVRSFEREIASVCRKVARRRAEGQTGSVTDHARRGHVVPRRAALRARGGRGAHARSGCRDRPGVDARGRRRPGHRGDAHARQAHAHLDRTARRRHEGVGPGCSLVGPVARR
jgi:ATP-dependent Lon protease